MGKWPYIPKEFDGKKFMDRYGLVLDDFWADDKFIYCRKDLPDDPPIFEPSNPRKPHWKTRLEWVRDLKELKELLKEV